MALAATDDEQTPHAGAASGGGRNPAISRRISAKSILGQFKRDISIALKAGSWITRGSTYNAHFGCNCYNPQFVFNQHGDVECSALRPGNVHSGDNCRAMLVPVMKRYRWTGLWRKYLRADAAVAIPELFDYLEANVFGYIIRPRANKVLQRRISCLLR